MNDLAIQAETRRRAVRLLCLALWLVLVLIGCTIPAPDSAPIAPTLTWEPVSHEVGLTIEGTYTVYIRSALVGYLNLSGGHYLFEPSSGTERPEGDNGWFFFMIHRRGNYYIEYYGSVDEHSRLEDLEDSAIISYIKFGENETEARDAIIARSHGVTDRVFLVRNDRRERELFFHSIANEFETWAINKPWH